MPLWLSLLSSLVILATSIYVLVITEVGPPENEALTSRGQRPVLTRAKAALRETCRKYAGFLIICFSSFFCFLFSVFSFLLSFISFFLCVLFTLFAPHKNIFLNNNNIYFSMFFCGSHFELLSTHVYSITFVFALSTVWFICNRNVMKVI